MTPGVDVLDFVRRYWGGMGDFLGLSGVVGRWSKVFGGGVWGLGVLSLMKCSRRASRIHLLSSGSHSLSSIMKLPREGLRWASGAETQNCGARGCSQ